MNVCSVIVGVLFADRCLVPELLLFVRRAYPVLKFD